VPRDDEHRRDRHGDPRDRRRRILSITTAGQAVRARVAQACERVEAAALDRFAPEQVQMLRRLLFDIVGDSEDPGSCL
jgi:MarR family transcriptional regulator, organic hydroperoxide resistance regulator